LRNFLTHGGALTDIDFYLHLALHDLGVYREEKHIDDKVQHPIVETRQIEFPAMQNPRRPN
jgi:hypothetical protein